VIVLKIIFLNKKYYFNILKKKTKITASYQKRKTAICPSPNYTAQSLGFQILQSHSKKQLYYKRLKFILTLTRFFFIKINKTQEIVYVINLFNLELQCITNCCDFEILNFLIKQKKKKKTVPYFKFKDWNNKNG